MVTRWSLLFWFAALFNLLVGLPMVLAPDMAAGMMGLPPPSPDYVLPLRMLGACILVFGLSYVLIARDLDRMRPVIWLNIAGKLSVVALTAHAALGAGVPQDTIMAAGGDLLFVAAFLACLARRPAPRADSP
ncbi:hypothetical protein [Zavarzinia sp. CC-PAN008]|uniref:hypothetical protein n=1 Tax=Zavarzinia sp. CC-PAN008 TaxID=3243332 RepID=UPI003F743DBC